MAMDQRKILYKQFLQDKRAYNLNVGYWRTKLQIALNEKFSAETTYVEVKNEKGKKFYDGNPIFSYVDKRKRKGVRIIQENPTELENYNDIKLLEAWISSVQLREPNEHKFEIQELVISLYLTHDTVFQCVNLVRQWFFSYLTEVDLGKL